MLYDFYMEIIGAWLADICNVTRHNVYHLAAKGNLTKTDSGKYNIHDPLNNAFLINHGKSKLDVEEYVEGRKPHVKKPLPVKKTNVDSGKAEKEALILLECTSIVISKNYSKKEAQKIKNEIMQEMRKRV